MKNEFLETVLDRTREAAQRWREEANDRRAVSTTDPVADALHFCARELEDHVEAIRASYDFLTTQDYAALMNVHENTVREWITQGKLEAYRGGEKKRGRWLIPRTARPK
jgi:excisionase family DNA binding protein